MLLNDDVPACFLSLFHYLVFDLRASEKMKTILIENASPEGHLGNDFQHQAVEIVIGGSAELECAEELLELGEWWQLVENHFVQET